jgi:hypothetical protein
MQKMKEVAHQRNEREGNRTSARGYNEEPQRFLRCGSIDRRAYDIEREQRENDIRREIEHAPMIGRRH